MDFTKKLQQMKIFFSANLSENNGVGQVKFNKSKTYEISGLSIDENIQVMFLCPMLREKGSQQYIKNISVEKSKFSLDLRFYKEDRFDINIPFKKRTDDLINRFE